MNETKTDSPIMPTTPQTSQLIRFGGELFEDFFTSAAEQLEASGGLSEEQNAELASYLQTENSEILGKRDRLGEFLARLDSEAEAIRAEEKRLAARRMGFNKIAACLRISIHQQMLDCGIRRVEGRLFSFAIRKNPTRVEIRNQDEIPPEFITYEPHIDRTAIKYALEEGKEVSGAELLQSTRLDIR
jgi:hypothetical protein